MKTLRIEPGLGRTALVLKVFLAAALGLAVAGLWWNRPGPAALALLPVVWGGISVSVMTEWGRVLEIGPDAIRLWLRTIPRAGILGVRASSDGTRLFVQTGENQYTLRRAKHHPEDWAYLLKELGAGDPPPESAGAMAWREGRGGPGSW